MPSKSFVPARARSKPAVLSHNGTDSCSVSPSRRVKALRVAVEKASAGTSAKAGQDLSPTLQRRLELSSLIGLGGLETVFFGREAEGEESTEEVKEWMSKTLANVPRQMSDPAIVLDSRLPLLPSESRAGSKEPRSEAGADAPKSLPPRGLSGGLDADCSPLAKLMPAGALVDDTSKMKDVYKRFKMEGSTEVHKDDLIPALQHLGSKLAKPEVVKELADCVTNFSTMDFDDFANFIGKFEHWEENQYREIFDRFDEDKSGGLDAGEISKFIAACGWTPLRKLVKEAFSQVSKSGCNILDFNETVELIQIYKCSEGFTRQEVKGLKKAFKKVAKAAGQESTAIEPGHLRLVLLEFFCGRNRAIVEKLQEQVNSSSTKKDMLEPNESHLMVFEEMLMWARRFREAEFEEMRAMFEKFDDDGSGSIDGDELRNCIRSLGYTLTHDVLREFLDEEAEADGPGGGNAEEAGKEEEHALDFDEFVNLMLAMMSRDGFSKAQVDEFWALFDRFDEHKKGQLTTQQIGDLLRHAGYNLRMDQVQRLVIQVDFYGTGVVSFREFIRLMRIVREGELQKCWKAYSEFRDPKLDGLPKSKVNRALASLDFEASQMEPDMVVKHEEGAEQEEEIYSFDMFIASYDKAAAIRAQQERRNAGFPESKLIHYRALFDSFNPEGSGVIEVREVGALLQELGFALTTAADRARVLAEIDKAREAAIDSGVTDVGQKGSGQLTFWVLVQLLRSLSSHSDQEDLARETDALTETKFTKLEVAEFKEGFQEMLMRETEFAKEVARNAVDRYPNPELETEATQVGKDGIKRLLALMKVKLTTELRVKLEHKIEELDQSGNLDFADFLRLMRWMLDTNFGGIAGAGR